MGGVSVYIDLPCGGCFTHTAAPLEESREACGREQLFIFDSSKMLLVTLLPLAAVLCLANAQGKSLSI